MIWSYSQAKDGQLEVHLFDERERVAQIKRSANQMQSSMDNIKSFLGDQPNDGEVCGKFANLTNDMKIWSIQFSGGNADSSRKERSSDYRRVAPGFTELQLLTEITMNKGKSDFHAQMDCIYHVFEAVSHFATNWKHWRRCVGGWKTRMQLSVFGRSSLVYRSVVCLGSKSIHLSDRSDRNVDLTNLSLTSEHLPRSYWVK
jgi:hypothetical protein